MSAIKLILVASIFLIAGTQHADASIIRVEFSGVVTNNFDPDILPFQTGYPRSAINGFYEFTTEATDIVADPSDGGWHNLVQTAGMVIETGNGESHSFSWAPTSGVSSSISLSLPPDTYQDMGGYALTLRRVGGPTFSGYAPLIFNFDITFDPSGLNLSDDLPTEPGALFNQAPAFNSNWYLSFYNQDLGNATFVTGWLTSMRAATIAVPTPPAPLLFLTGIIGFGLARMRSRI